MDGRNLGCGAVTMVTNVKNPVLAAKEVLLNSPHIMLGGAAAEAVAEKAGLPPVANAFFDTPGRLASLQRHLAA
eukprot:7588209-Prorocentrum_lima.AAC.1